MYVYFNSEIIWLIYDILLLSCAGYKFSILCAYYGRPVPMALAFR